MAEAKKEIELEIAHVLFIDIVGYSKLSMELVFYTSPEAPAQCRQSLVLSAEAELDPKTSPHHSRNPAGPIRGLTTTMRRAPPLGCPRHK